MRRDKALIFPWEKKKKRKPDKYIYFSPLFLRSYHCRDIFNHVNCYSIVFWTPQTGGDNNGPSSQLSQAAGWEQAENLGKQSVEQKKKKSPLLLLREDRPVWHQSYRPEKITLSKERRDGKDAAARNSHRASNQLKISYRPSDVLGKAKSFLLLQLPTRKEKSKIEIHKENG